MAKAKPTAKKSTKRKASNPSTSASKSTKSSSKKVAKPNPANSNDAASSSGTPCGQKKPRIMSRIVPEKSLTDPKEYRIIKLENGLTVALISRCNPTTDSGVVINGSALKPSPKTRFRKPGKFRNYHGHSFLNYNGYSHLGRHPVSGKLKSCNEEPKISPDEQYTSIALVLSVGGFNDPENFQGLAHFMEHSVYLGSKEFPEEDVFEIEIATFAPVFNATTTPSTTSYYNEIPDILLEKNLSIIENMIKEPLLKNNMLEKEVHAVDCEFYRRLHIWQSFIVLPSFVMQNKAHSFGKLLCGNRETLKTRSEQETTDLQKVMFQYHKQYYGAKAMTLCLNSTKSLDDLEVLALKYFSDFAPGARQLSYKENDGKSPELKSVSRENLHYYYYVQGNIQCGMLQLIWTLDIKELKTPNDHAIDIITALLSDTSEKCLDATLREQGLVLDFNVYADFYPTFGSAMIYLVIVLTETGRNNTLKIVSLIMSYLTVLSGLKLELDTTHKLKTYFEELRTCRLRAFHYEEQDSSLDYTQRCAMSLQQVEDTTKFLSTDSWIDAKYNHCSVIAVFKQLLDRNKLTIIETLPKQVKLEDVQKRNKSSSQIMIDMFIKAKYFEAKVQFPDILAYVSQFSFPKESFLKYLGKITVGNGPCAKEIPAPPKNFGKIPEQVLVWKSKMDHPGESSKHFIPKITGYHEGHDEVSNYRYDCGVSLSFSSFFSRSNVPRTWALALIWATVIENKVRKKKDRLLVSGNWYFIAPDITLVVGGFPQIEIFECIIAVITAMFEESITQQEFDIAHESVSLLFESLDPEDIMAHIIYALVDPVDTNYQDFFDLSGQISDITLGELQSTIEAFKLSSSCHVVLVGNVPVSVFRIIAQILENENFGPILDNGSHLYKQLRPRNGIFVPGEKCIRIRNLGSPGYLTTVTNYYVIPIDDFWEQLYFDVAYNFMGMQSFNYLRTHEQLGYDVQVQAYEVIPKEGFVVAFSIMVAAIAKNFTVCELDAKIDEFLSIFGNKLRTLDNHCFATFKTLNPIYEDIEQNEVADWVTSTFGASFNPHTKNPNSALNECSTLGMQKISLQVISGNPEANTKPCCCKVCSDIVAWTPGKARQSKLLYAKGQGAAKDYFVDSFLK